jgi:hypothetical protein
MSTITTEQQAAIASKLATMHLPSGRTVESADAAADATRAAWAAAGAAVEAVEAVEAGAWANFDPCGLLERLVKIDNNAQEAK